LQILYQQLCIKYQTLCISIRLYVIKKGAFAPLVLDLLILYYS